MGSAHGRFGSDDSNARLLTDPVSQAEDEEGGVSGKILYRATFDQLEKDYVNYDTVLWILISLLLILAWGVGILMLLYLPIRRYILQQDIRSHSAINGSFVSMVLEEFFMHGLSVFAFVV